MKYSEIRCKAAAYDFYLEDGKEKEIETLSISGKPIKRSACMFAKKGDFPNYITTVTYDEALDFMRLWIGNCMIHGQWATLYDGIKKGTNVNKVRAYEKMNVGDVFNEFYFDFHKNGKAVYRIKFIFTKA